MHSWPNLLLGALRSGIRRSNFVLYHLRKVRLGLDVGGVGNVCRQFSLCRCGGGVGLCQVAEERVGQRHDLAWARLAGGVRTVALQPHKAQWLQRRAGDAHVLGVVVVVVEVAASRQG